MSRSAKIPPWVKLGALARHKPSNVLFFIGHIQRSPNQQLYLCDFARGRTGTRYLLEECEPANYLIHLKSVAILTDSGSPLSVERHGARLIIASDTRRIAVDTDPQWWVDSVPTMGVEEAARSLASAFGGAIAEEAAEASWYMREVS